MSVFANSEVVTVPRERYEELLDTDTRVSVLIDTMNHDGCITLERAYRILGYTNEANKIKDKGCNDEYESENNPLGEL